MSPAPVVRPTLGRQWDLQHVELFPHRPEGVTADMRAAFRCFLHVMVFGADRLGRPVGVPGNLYLPFLVPFASSRDSCRTW